MNLSYFSQANRTIPLISGFLVIILFCTAYYFMPESGNRLIFSLDSQVFSAMFKFRGKEKTSGKVVIVDIDEPSLKALGQWPWSRDILARLVNKIEDSHPLSLGLDMIFPEKDRSSPSNWLDNLEKKTYTSLIPVIQNLKQNLKQQKNYNFDTLFGDALFRPNTITGFSFTFSAASGSDKDEVPFVSANINVSPHNVPFSHLNLSEAKGVVLNIPDIDQGESQGFINVFPNAGGIIHKIPLLVSFNSLPYPSLALETARIGLKIKNITIHTSENKIDNKNTIIGISLGNRFIPTDNFGAISVNYRGPLRTFKYCSAIDIINGKYSSLLKNKFVLIGTSASGLSDLRATPFSSAFPGVEINATIIDNIIKQDAFQYDRFTESMIIYLIVILGGAALTVILTFTTPLLCGSAGLAFFSVVLVGNYKFFFMNHKLIGVVYPLVSVTAVFATVIVTSLFFKEKEKKFIENAFAHYLAPSLVSQLLEQPEKLSLEGKEKEVTIFFSDIRNFTTISEKISSEKIAKLLNFYLSAMTDIILDRKGMVDKYIGDAIMAIWGIPLDDPFHAENAMNAGLEMAEALKKMNVEWTAMGFPQISIGMGLNTGIVNVGNFGTSKRFDYTVVGKNVNLASRLESLNKYYGTSFLISQNTKNMAGGKFYSRFVDIVRVKGMDEPVKIFEPVCSGQPSAEIKINDKEFQAAFRMYRKGHFLKSKKMFEQCKIRDKRQINDVFIERINAFIKHPPDKDTWQGIYTFSAK